MKWAAGVLVLLCLVGIATLAGRNDWRYELGNHYLGKPSDLVSWHGCRVSGPSIFVVWKTSPRYWWAIPPGHVEHTDGNGAGYWSMHAGMLSVTYSPKPFWMSPCEDARYDN
jgi:hypothetical protein